MRSIEHARAHSAIVRGAIDEALDALRSPEIEHDASARAWTLAARAAGSLLDPQTFVAPSLGELGAYRDASPELRVIAALACAHLERAAVLGFEADQLEQCVALHGELARGDHDASEARQWLALGEHWLRWMRGEPNDLDPALAEIERRARASGSAALVIDVGALRALGAEARGDIAGMLALARRTSRMARTEAMPAHEHLAHLVLARARRAARHPHLAIRILGALDRFVADPCRAWVRWERLLAADADALEGERPGERATRAERAAAALAAVLRAAMAGDETAFDRCSSALTSSVRGLGFASREARHVLVALDARIDPAGEDPEIAAWCSGRETLAPSSIHGLCVRIAGESQDASEALVLAEPDRPARRVLGASAALVAHAPRVHLRKTHRRRGRVETLIAILACAGSEGLADGECFARAYEMPYDSDSHRGVFEVLVTRARLYVQEAGEIVRGRGRIALRLRAPMSVPGPQCAAPEHDRILRVLAHEGRVTASDAAKRVGLSLRATQQALRSLADDGICVGEKEGRQIAYAIEDTTFSEPTQLLALGRRG